MKRIKKLPPRLTGRSTHQPSMMLRKMHCERPGELDVHPMRVVLKYLSEPSSPGAHVQQLVNRVSHIVIIHKKIDYLL